MSIEVGLELGSALSFGIADEGAGTRVAYFTVPLSVAFATPDAPTTSASGTARITLVDVSNRITTVHVFAEAEA